MSLPRAAGCAAAIAVVLAAVRPARAQDHPDRPAAARAGSLVTTAPLGAGRVGMSLGGGVAVLLPFYGVEAGVGIAKRVDLVGRFESVLGVLHYPYVGVRWNPIELGAWRVGTRLLAHYSFFGIATDQINLTSTFYMSGELGISGPITKATDLVLAADAELDIFEYRVADDEGRVEGNLRYDATNLRFGLKTRLTDDLDGYALARVRIPVETLTYEATSFYVIPFLEIGGSWSF